jgi:predicted RND superfamily exporter protein
MVVPSVLGLVRTKTKYDLLYYLPQDLETVQGQEILLKHFGKGAFSLLVTEGMSLSEQAEMENALKEISEIDILKTGGIIVCEKPFDKGLDPAYGGIRHAKDYRYGKTMISVYRAAAPFDGQ